MRKSHVSPLHVFTTPAQSRMPRVELPAQSIWNIAFLKGHSLLLFLRLDCLKGFSISYKPIGHFQKHLTDYFFLSINFQKDLFIFLKYVHACVSVWVCAHEYKCLQRPEEGVEFLELELTALM